MSSSVPPYPRKRFGQNFLVDHNIVKKIVARAALSPHETVLEIGPGRGALTRVLCQVATRVLAVEIDEDLFRNLQDELKAHVNLELSFGDALAYPYTTLPPHTVVVANLPYNISTPLLFKLFDARASVDRMILMLQLEVAKRLAAKAGTREYGVLSVLAQYFADVDVAFTVSRTCFRPRPDVESAIVELRLKPPCEMDRPEDIQQFVRVVKAAFSHRRKTLLNAMRDAGMASDALKVAFEGTGIHGGRRAETLTVHDFQRLARMLALA
ncbi:MAG: ribosomal RNA small subunit methyltransferase A [Nitrospirales bacterium]|nr:MAG: ribosomal RNA small subunit methyltransferase A [Nitrospirales bacterium]